MAEQSSRSSLTTPLLASAHTDCHGVEWPATVAAHSMVEQSKVVDKLCITHRRLLLLLVALGVPSLLFLFAHSHSASATVSSVDASRVPSPSSPVFPATLAPPIPKAASASHSNGKDGKAEVTNNVPARARSAGDSAQATHVPQQVGAADKAKEKHVVDGRVDEHDRTSRSAALGTTHTPNQGATTRVGEESSTTAVKQEAAHATHMPQQAGIAQKAKEKHAGAAVETVLRKVDERAHTSRSATRVTMHMLDQVASTKVGEESSAATEKKEIAAAVVRAIAELQKAAKNTAADASQKET